MCREFFVESNIAKAFSDVLIASINVLYRKLSISRKTIKGDVNLVESSSPSSHDFTLYPAVRASWRGKDLEQLS